MKTIGFKIGAITFALLTFTAMKAMILLDETTCVNSEDASGNDGCVKVPSTNFPDFDEPFEAEWNPKFHKDSSWFGEDVANAIANIGVIFAEMGEFVIAAVIWIFDQIVNTFQISIILIKWIVFFISILFYTIPGAPWFINLVMVSIPITAVFMVIALARGTTSQ